MSKMQLYVLFGFIKL